MPYFSIETNQTIGADANIELMKKTTGFLAKMMGKPEHIIMVTIKPGMPYTFGGSDELTAYVQVKAVALEKNRCPDFSKQVCDFLETEIGIPKDRVFIEFIDLDPKIFGFNGSTLAR